MARRAGGKAAKRRRRSERIWTSTFVDASESVPPVADSARFCRRVRMQSNGPRASKLEADGVEAEWERRPCEWLRKYAGSARSGAVRSRRVSSCASRGVRSAMLWHHMCVGRGSSTREQENPRVRGEVGIANPFGSIVSSHGPQHPTVLTPCGSLNRYHHESPRRLLLRPSSTHGNPSRQISSSSTEPHHRRALPIANPVHRRNSLSTHSPPQSRLLQGLP
jgi:hypothetical protein